VYLHRLELVNFRCYRHLEIDLPKGPILLVGANAQGKTSLLEAAFVLATTRAPYGILDRMLIHWGAGDEVIPFSRVWGQVERTGGPSTIDIVNVRTTATPGDERFTKRLRLDDAPRRAMDVIGTLNVVLFTPRDIDLIHGAPAERRRYLDVLLCQIDRNYVRALGQYNHVVVQRNHLLRRLRDRGGDRSELAVWDEPLVTHGARILSRRAAAARQLDALAHQLHIELVGDDQRLGIAYRSQVVEAGGDAATDPTRSPDDLYAAPGVAADAASAEAELAQRFRRLLAGRREEEIARGVSLIGPHRDDLELRLDGVDLRPFGSRGQQRTVTLALKLAEAGVMWRTTGERPVLLLDDVLSELDRNRRQRLLAHVSAHEQALITTTDVTAVDHTQLEHATVLDVAAAVVRKREV